MPQKKADRLQPEKYVGSIRDPNYSYEENHYVLTHFFRAGPHPLTSGVYKRWEHGQSGDSLFTIEEKEDLARSYAKEIEAGWKRDRKFKGLSGSVYSGWVFQSERMEWVIGAVRIFGMDAIRLFESNYEVVRTRNKGHLQYPLFSALDDLGKRVCRVIRFWKYRGEIGDLEQRREATQWLGKIFGELIPKTKGKRKKSLVGSRKEVLSHYLKELFRAYNLLEGVKSGPRNINVRLKTVADNFQVPVGDLMTFLRVDDQGKPYRNPMSPKEIALILTSQKFKITQQTVRNILSELL